MSTPTPYAVDPLVINNKPQAFELVVKPGILATDMTYGFTPYWNDGGYCKVDWGDGLKEDATKSGTALSHTYAVAGAYTIKIKAECYWIRFDTTGKTLIESCSENLDKLGNLTDGTSMFLYCSNAQLPLTSLPETLTNGNNMFNGCTNAQLNLTKLPDGLTSGAWMFNNCRKAKIALTSLPEGLLGGSNMFFGCQSITINISRLPSNLRNGRSMFQGLSDSQVDLTSLPDGLTDGFNMFLGCSKSKIKLNELPAGLTEGQNMFSGCKASEITLTHLPANLKTAAGMFKDCINTEINLDTLVANAPADGWTQLTNISNMFNGCSKVTGSRSAFLAKCPNVTTTTDTFKGTNTTE